MQINKGSTNSSCNIKRQETHRLQIWQFVIDDAEQLMERFWQLAKPVYKSYTSCDCQQG